MGFASGRVTLRRFRVAGLNLSGIDDTFLEKLNAAAFGRYGSAAADGVDMGWITPHHLFDVDFAADKIAVGRFAHWSLRIERNSPPSAIVRSYYAMEQAAALEASGREFLNKRELREAKAAAVSRAEMEARSGAFRRIQAYPVILDLERAALYLHTTSNGVGERMQRLFADTFDARIETLTAHALAEHAVGELGAQRAWEDAKPVHFVNPPDDIDGDVYGLDPEDRGFLGREFLTWIWYTASQAEGVFELLRHADVAITPVMQMQLKCDFNLTGSTALRSDDPARSAEARAGLAAGKQATRMGMILAARVGEWTFALDGTTLDVTGLVLPQVDEKDKRVVLEERCGSLADLMDVLDELYGKFLRLRLSGEWSAVERAMREWAAGPQGQGQTAARLVSA
jgi:hypothetical protein